MTTLLARAFGGRKPAEPLTPNQSSASNSSNTGIGNYISHSANAATLSSFAPSTPGHSHPTPGSYSSSTLGKSIHRISFQTTTNDFTTNISEPSSARTAQSVLLNEPKEYFTADRHQSNNRDLYTGEYRSKYRLKSALSAIQSADYKNKDKIKTTHVALVICMNIGVDPPDQEKPQPHAVTHCWLDPAAQPPHKSLEAIGMNLQEQYERVSQKRSAVISLQA